MVKLNLIQGFEYLPDLSMSHHRSRYGEMRHQRAQNVLEQVLELLPGESEEWVGLRYLFDPGREPKHDRLRLFIHIKVAPAGGERATAVPGIHFVEAFFKCRAVASHEAIRGLEPADWSVFTISRAEEAQRRVADAARESRFYYAIVPVKSVEDRVLTACDFDRLFDGLRSACVVDLFVRPRTLDKAKMRNDLIQEIQFLDRWATGFEPDKSTGGARDDFDRYRDTIASRHMGFFKQEMEEAFGGRVFEFLIRVATPDPHEGKLVSRVFGANMLGDGCYHVNRINPEDQGHHASVEAISEFRDSPLEYEILEETCWSERLAAIVPKLIDSAEGRTRRLCRLSRFSQIVGREIAARILRLPTSDGVLLNTIRIESEFFGQVENKGDDEPAIELGEFRQRAARATVGLEQIQRHVFVAGVTGSGKTTSLLNMLIELWEQHGIPFLVLEPAKSEYRVLLERENRLGQDLRLYTPGNEAISPFRFNPLELLPGVTVDSQIGLLETCFRGAFSLEGPMPHWLARGIQRCYEQAGFGLGRISMGKENWPTMPDLADAVAEEMRNAKYSGDINANLSTALDVRLRSLCSRSIGMTLCAAVSQPSLHELMTKPTIIELKHFNLDQQNLFILFLLTAIHQHLSQGNRNASAHDHCSLEHVIVLEEAHNLIGAEGTHSSVPDGTANPRAHATKFLVNMLAEVRALGEGIIIADQSPASVAPEVLKQTNVKLVHRIVSEDDRDAIAGAMLLDEYGHEDLARLRPGEAFLYHDRLYRPLRMTSRFLTRRLTRGFDIDVANRLYRTEWFESHRLSRIAELRYQFDEILRATEALVNREIQAKRADGRSEERDARALRVTSSLLHTRQQLRRHLSLASLDRSMKKEVGELELETIGRLNSLRESVCREGLVPSADKLPPQRLVVK